MFTVKRVNKVKLCNPFGIVPPSEKVGQLIYVIVTEESNQNYVLVVCHVPDLVFFRVV